jgi:hypothetical protein
MKRIIAVLALAAAIAAVPAASALGSMAVRAPNNGYYGNGGQSANNAPDRSIVTCIPQNDGTQTARGPSPAVGYYCYQPE